MDWFLYDNGLRYERVKGGYMKLAYFQKHEFIIIVVFMAVIC